VTQAIRSTVTSEMTGHWLNSSEAAAYVGLHVKIFRKLVQKHKIRHARTQDSQQGHLRFKREWLDEWLESTAVGGQGAGAQQ